ncbi:hypothetical protein LTR17_000174 [Elasticomyces elasticus]|nr:hypothetical protein LTR17_000174 [Elasticomyces elasticus]
MLVSVARPGTLARLCSASCRLALGVRRPKLVRHFWPTPRIQLKNPESIQPHHKNVPTDSETASIEPLPIAAFLERVKDGSATIDDAQCCLEHHYSILADLPPSTRQEQARSLKVDGQLLKWLWEVCHDDRARVYDDQLFSNRLCWFLVLEDLEDLVWKWIKMETKQATESPMAEQLMHPGRGPQWTGRLLGGLAQAHLDLAPGRMADNALRRFRQVADLRSPDGTGFLGSQLVQMRVAIQRALLRNECPPCDAKLFDHFEASTPVVDRPDRVALTRARLRLFHPTKPTARPILHLVRVKHPVVEKVLREARPAAIRSMTSHMLRAACILCLEDADDDASFLEALVQQKDPKLWYNREKFWLSQTADPKLKALVGASERSGELSHISARWSTASALSTQVPRTRTQSVPSVRSRSFSQCARPQVIAKQGYASTIGRYYSKGYHEGDSEDTGVVSIETFVESAAAGLATISDAQSCVMHYYRTFSELPISQRADVVKSLAIGSQVLQWLLTRPGKEIIILSKDHGSRDALCWLLVVEGKEDSAWERLNNLARMNRQKLGDDITKDQARDHDWPGALIAGFAAAHLALANNRLAEHAIKCFQRLVKLRREGRRCFVSLGPDGSAARVHLARARLLLFQPTQATASPLLRLVRANEPDMESIFRARPAARKNFAEHLLRASYILRLHGEEDDAAFLDHIVKERTPAAWRAREHIWRRHRLDPKLRGSSIVPRRQLPTWSASRKTRMFSTSALFHPRNSPTRASSRSFSCSARLQAAGAGSDPLMMKIDRFQKSVEEGKATLEDAQQCLLELQTDLMRLPLKERRLKCQELMAGGKVLHWLWKVRKADYANIYDGTNVQAFSTLHLWFLVPENLEEFVWKWLHIVANHILSSRNYTATDKRLPINQQQEYNEFGWAHHILGALAEAHVQWSVDGTINDALRAWERAFHTFGPASNGREWRAIPLVAMSVCIARHLNRDDLAPCDPELYDTWGRTYAQSGLAGPHRLVNRRVRHDLYHPTHADAASMLHMVYHSGRPLDDVMFLHSRATGRNNFAGDMMRAAYILHLQGRTRDAIGLEDIVERMVPEVFFSKPQMHLRWDGDPRLHHLRKSEEEVRYPFAK